MGIYYSFTKTWKAISHIQQYIYLAFPVVFRICQVKVCKLRQGSFLKSEQVNRAWLEAHITQDTCEA